MSDFSSLEQTALRNDPNILASATCSSCLFEGWIDFKLGLRGINRLPCPKCRAPETMQVIQLLGVMSEEITYYTHGYDVQKILHVAEVEI